MPDESKKWSEQGMEAMLNHLLQTPADYVAPPEWAYPTRDEDLLQRIRNPATTPEEKAQVQRDLNIRKSEHMADLINWWTQRMARSPAPLLEKMTLFWHGHFATSADKVSAYRMWLQNETIRRYALSNFGTLVKAISCDPAMLNWLDLGSSQKEHPNENFARELMELFTLGEGHYTEDDVKAAARAFTCYRVVGPTEQFRFVAAQFDPLSSPSKETGTSSNTPGRANPSHSINNRFSGRQIRFRHDRKDPRRIVEKLSRAIFPSYTRGGTARQIREDCRFKPSSF